MKTHKNNGKTLWALPALSLVALSLTAGTGCDPQATDSQTALEAATNPSAATARFTSPPFGTRLGFGDTISRLVNPVIEARLEPANTAGISMLR